MSSRSQYRQYRLQKKPMTSAHRCQWTAPSLLSIFVKGKSSFWANSLDQKQSGFGLNLLYPLCGPEIDHCNCESEPILKMSLTSKTTKRLRNLIDVSSARGSSCAKTPIPTFHCVNTSQLPHHSPSLYQLLIEVHPTISRFFEIHVLRSIRRT